MYTTVAGLPTYIESVLRLVEHIGTQLNSITSAGLTNAFSYPTEQHYIEPFADSKEASLSLRCMQYLCFTVLIFYASTTTDIYECVSSYSPLQGLMTLLEGTKIVCLAS